MVSLIPCLLSALFTRDFRRVSIIRRQSGYTFPWPKTIHRILDEEFLSNFNSIFAIGDVHGCYDELIELINTANATDDSCLKIFVGDLINKGPKNPEVLHFVRNSKSVLSVRGNHEEVVLRNYYCFKEGQEENNKYKIEEWVKHLSDDDVGYLNDLPYTITIPTLNTIIVHAGLVPGLPLNKNTEKNMVSMRNLIFKDYFGEGGIQGTNDDTKGDPWAPLWQGPERVIFGHDAKRKLQKHPFAIGLDTGCLYGGFLTGLFLSGENEGKFVQVKAHNMYVKPGKKE